MRGIKFFTLTIFSFILIRCASTPGSNFNDNENVKIEASIKSGQTQVTQSLIDNKNSITNFDRFKFIFFSLKNDCNTEIVNTILDKNDSPFEKKLKHRKNPFDKFRIDSNLPVDRNPTDIINPGGILISTAANNFCVDSLILLSELVSNEDFSLGLYNNLKFKLQKLEGSYSRRDFQERGYLNNLNNLHINTDVISDRIEKKLATKKFIIDRITTDCKSHTQEACIAKEIYQKHSKQIDEAIKEEEYKQSPAGLLELACKKHFEKKRHMKMIEEEKERAKYSGYVYANSMKKIGDMVYFLKNEFEKINAQYRKKTGSNIDTSVDCN